LRDTPPVVMGGGAHVWPCTMVLIPLRNDCMKKDRSARTGLLHEKGSPAKDYQTIYDLTAGKQSGS